MKRKFINKAMSIALSTAMLVGAVPTYPVFAANTGATSVDINVLATNIDITVPSNVTCTIDPNQVEPADRFMYGELNITNNGTAPVDVSITSFTDADSTFENNITPEGLPEGKSWETLNVSDTSKYFALGIKANDASNWNNLTLNDYVYVPEVTAPNLVGTLTSGSAGKMDLDASFGLNFKTVKDFSYELVFNAELSGGEATPSTILIDEEATTPLNYELTPDGSASINLNNLLGIDSVYAAPTEVNKNDFDNSRVVGTATVTGLKDTSAVELYIADYYQAANGDYYKITGIKEGSQGNGTIVGNNLERVVVSSSITEIPDYAFYSNQKLVDVEISEGITRIGKYAFYTNQKMETLQLPNSLKEIDHQAFANCFNLKSVNSDIEGVCNLPEGLETLGVQSFYANYYIKDINIPSTLESMDYRNFGSSGATEDLAKVVYLPAQTEEELPEITLNMETMGSSAGTHDYSTYFNSNSYFYTETNDLAYALKIKTQKDIPVFSKESIYICVFSETETEASLEKINRSTNTITASFTVPSTYNGKPVTSITGTTSTDFYGIKLLTLPDTIETVTTSKVLSNINYLVYEGTADTSNWGAKQVLDSSLVDDNFIYGEGKTTISSYVGSGTTVEIPAGITEIGQQAFTNCKTITSITFAPESQLTTIGNQAFNNCKALEEINLPSTVTSIGTSAFYGCEGITEFRVPSGITTISNGMLNLCKNMTTVYIPKTVTKIEANALSNCTNLAIINYEGTESEWKQITVEYPSSQFTNATKNYETY